MKRLLPVVLPLFLGSCNQYDLFQFTGFEQEKFSTKADILFVVDNSDSMQEEAEALATSFAAFVNDLAAEQQDFPTEDLSDAVSIYASYVGDPDNFVNYQLGVTTTDVDAGPGVLYGAGKITRLDDDVPNAFATSVLCEATCFADPPPAGGSCGDPLGANVTSTWLDCECDTAWQANCGGAKEEHLEAVFMTMCRSVPNPPAACFDEIDDFGPADVESNKGFIRTNSTLIPVVVTDEGDDSRRLQNQEPLPVAYANLFAQFNTRMVWTVIGPYREQGGGFPCPTGASNWGTLRLSYFVESTNGLYVPITDQANGCNTRDFDDALDQLGQLLRNLNRTFRLSTLPEAGSIAVFTSDGGVIHEAELLGFSDSGVPQYEDGWSYDLQTNTVLLHGDAIPEVGEDVTVYYKPQDGNPRNLPF
ncbi:MAG: hypothetical protein H6737_27300 [Alphaproteobacteria bacterium]|nr:hypothetical protein [Alphaproteobacteria bacterium]